MKRTMLMMAAAMTAMLCMATDNRSNAPTLENYYCNKEFSPLMYYYSSVTRQAKIVDWAIKYPSQVYDIENIVVPATFSMKGISMNSDGDSQSQITIKVVEIGENGFYNSTAKSVTFAAESNIRTISKSALASMANMSGTLTLPASLQTLAVSSILLPNVTKIVFEGAVPPTCATEGNYNPWTSASETTAASTEVVVPNGSLAVYKKAAHIGTYFTNIHTASNKYYVVTFYDEDGTTELQSLEVGKNEVPVYSGKELTKAEDENYTYSFDGWDTEIVAATSDVVYKAKYRATAKVPTSAEAPKTESKAQKVMEKGVVYIIREGVRYDARGQKAAQ